jgi:hypothetical protein
VIGNLRGEAETETGVVAIETSAVTATACVVSASSDAGIVTCVATATCVEIVTYVEIETYAETVISSDLREGVVLTKEGVGYF